MVPPKAFGGPYKLKEWRANEVTILERNVAWAGEPPAFDEVRLDPIADPQAGEIAFEAGDVAYTPPSAASLQRYTDSPPANGSVADYPRSAERRVGTECSSTCGSSWWPNPYKTKRPVTS